MQVVGLSYFSPRFFHWTSAAFVTAIVLILFVVYEASLPVKWPVRQLFDDEQLLDFDKRPFVFYTISYHASPIHDLIDLLGPLGVRFIDKGVAGWTYGCGYFHSCRSSKPLRAVGRDVGRYMNASRIVDFYEEYKNDTEIQSADAFICMHPSATCELFEMFNKPIVILSTIRYDSGRQIKQQWIEWHYRFYRIARNPTNLIAANNLYDVHFTRYYIGVEPILLPSYCGYTNQVYSPTRPGFLLSLRRGLGFQRFFLREFNAASQKRNSSVVLRPIRDVYSAYRWSDLAAHWGIVQLPAQPSTMSIFEQYRMNIPLFFPSKRLMLDWEMNGHSMMDEVQSPHRDVGKFRMPAHRNWRHVPDPTVRDRVSANYWNQFCDWYHLPHVIHFDNVTHLVDILNSMTPGRLRQVSDAMRDYNRRFKVELLAKWKQLLRRMAAISRTKRQPLVGPTEFNHTIDMGQRPNYSHANVAKQGQHLIHLYGSTALPTPGLGTTRRR